MRGAEFQRKERKTGSNCWKTQGYSRASSTEIPLGLRPKNVEQRFDFFVRVERMNGRAHQSGKITSGQVDL